MAGWRHAIGLAMTDEEIETLTALSRSRTEPASRVSRAAMLLAYRENPSFFAAARRLGVHHQTVQRCIERAVAYGVSGGTRRPTATGQRTGDHAGSQGLAGVFGVRQGQGARLSARAVDDAAFGPSCARARTGGGSRMSRPSGSGHGVQDSRPRGNQAA